MHVVFGAEDLYTGGPPQPAVHTISMRKLPGWKPWSSPSVCMHGGAGRDTIDDGNAVRGHCPSLADVQPWHTSGKAWCRWRQAAGCNGRRPANDVPGRGARISATARADSTANGTSRWRPMQLHDTTPGLVAGCVLPAKAASACCGGLCVRIAMGRQGTAQHSKATMCERASPHWTPPPWELQAQLIQDPMMNGTCGAVGLWPAVVCRRTSRGERRLPSSSQPRLSHYTVAASAAAYRRTT